MRWRDWHARRRRGVVRLTIRQWGALAVFALIALVVAVGVGPPRGNAPRVSAVRVMQARTALAALATLPNRPPHDTAYDRDAFGTAWTDASDAPGAGNNCDTRNDILARDLEVSGQTAITSCPRAVSAGVLTSPYTGRSVVFERGRASAAVQIDHVVPLSYAWDLGAKAWPRARRTRFANDPANLVAVDGPSNQAKSDAEPAVWMPPLDGFHCQYAVQFVTVLHMYGLPVDEPSRAVLFHALAAC
ncbi:HNH endonuclease family protein [Gordonia sp. HY002]|uniref:HNH endonuclease family protein n=1 Tax=Gordonia zhenghanii TaxID=2911516 RepID=UPI001EF0E7A0|nr:HNH endonuclease family protein [Gordonia zhenghanii]MCF8572304.1 HNH endonuclease family protein [Gordonia zhenghanii]MCF8605989.1 HNH endonuclease family protein [Gordonia zhenghanii]